MRRAKDVFEARDPMRPASVVAIGHAAEQDRRRASMTRIRLVGWRDGRSRCMDRRAVKRIPLKQLSGKRPDSEQIGDLDLCPTLFTTAPPDRAAVSAGGKSTA